MLRKSRLVDEKGNPIKPDSYQPLVAREKMPGRDKAAAADEKADAHLESIRRGGYDEVKRQKAIERGELPADGETGSVDVAMKNEYNTNSSGSTVIIHYD